MSYILDALKKSDQQRQRGAAPSLRSAPAPIALPEKSSSWRYTILVIALIGAGMLVGWLRPWQPESQSPGNSPRASSNATADAKIAVPEAPPGSAAYPGEAAPAQAPAPAIAAEPVAPLMPRSEIVAPRAPAPAIPRIAPRVALPTTDKPASIAQPDTTADQGHVMAMEELPLGIRQELPELTISMHAYSPNPAKRLVSINNKLLHEGDTAASGVKLEKITPEGMIFSFRGYRFSRGVQ